MNLVTGIVIIIGSLVIGIIVISIILIWLKSHRLRVIDETGQNTFIRDFWVIEKDQKYEKTKIGTKWVSVWFQPRYQTEKPPTSAINIGSRGRKYAECYHISEDEVAWVSTRPYPDRIMTDEKGQKVFDPKQIFGKTDRATVISQYSKAEEHNRNRKGWTADKVVAMTGIIGLVMLVTVSLIFLPDVIKEGNRFVSGLASAGDKFDLIVQKQDQILSRSGCYTGSMVSSFPQTPPTSSNNVINTDKEEPPLTEE